MTAPNDGRTGRSDLGDTEQQLRRLLNLEGVVPMDWAGMIQPVAVVGDCTLPGFGGQRLRRFCFTCFTFVPLGEIWFKAQADLIIDRVVLVTGASNYLINYLGPNDADPGAIVTRNVPMIDRALTSQELAPVTTGNLGLAGGSVIYSSGAIILPNGLFEVAKQPFLLAQGAKLRFSTGANSEWQVEGRVF